MRVPKIIERFHIFLKALRAYIKNESITIVKHLALVVNRDIGTIIIA